MSIPRRAQHFEFPYDSLWRILQLDLHIHSTHSINEVSRQSRTYAIWVIEQQVINAFFNDEAHSTLYGYVNKQNCRTLSSKDPQVILERPLHPVLLVLIFLKKIKKEP